MIVHSIRHDCGTNTFAFNTIQHHIVKTVQENIKPNKAQTCDFIPPRAVRCDFVNTIISSSQVPDTWKHGQITPLHKKRQCFGQKNYRPVTVLPVFGEVFERLITCKWRNILSRSFTIFCLRIENKNKHLQNTGRRNLILYQVIAATAIDLSKAFDYLPHGLILEKLRFYGMGEKAVNLLHSYISSRYQRVKVGDAFSAWTGVASILGPLLFIIFYERSQLCYREG